MENDWISDLLKLMVSRKILSVLVMTIVVGSLLAIVASKAARAEDEKEDKEYEKEDSEHEYEKEQEKEDSWDLSEDFKPVAPVTPPASVAETPTVENVVVKKIIKKEKPNPQIEIVKLNMTIEEPKNLTIPEFNETPYLDDDNDTIINKYDQYPGQNDLAFADSDNDGIKDIEDRYNGKNDLDFEDNDNDGVMDSRDSNPDKATDKDHDGIDDAYDTKDDRTFIVKLFSFLGLMR
jgi:hypothetical protein